MACPRSRAETFRVEAGFDLRTKSLTGEHAVVSFDESIQKLPRMTKPERI